MNILHVGSWFGPPFDGGRVFRYELIKRLGRAHRQYFVVPGIASDLENATLETLAKLGIAAVGVRAFLRPPIGNLARLAGLLFSQLPPGIAFLERKIGPTLRRTLQESAKQFAPDISIVWSPNLAGLCRPALVGKAILFACDAMQLVNHSLAEKCSQPWRRAYHRRAALRYARWTAREYARYDHVVFIGERDREWCPLPGTPTSVIPMGVDAQAFAPRPGRRDPAQPVLFFHGSFNYEANAEAVNWLLEVLGPALARRFGENGFELRLCGKNASAAQIAKIAARPWAKYRGYVEDLTGELNAATCYVAPIDMGGGMKTKIMEAMACGLPIVGNPEAFSGLSIEAGAQAVVSDRGGFVSAVLDLLESPSKRAELGRDARKWIVENAGWDMGAQSLHDIVIALAATASAQSGEKINEQDHQGLAMRDQSGRECL